ncbi:Gfo/Idh/MocA family oxidoreductase [Rhabdobacter roseus]|uniref:Putative dehydrogenase n=1 Tax=Rhabdobacter roseus TaxID=1655419 RepID=A0A840TK67_9BACT|nr:Gfo/Idh/MocA family oxidoreductase [Rhabdobacter roseus]MBB5281942.1 putative dehydrogenase [Rhabdobacter roseus]
MPTKTRRHFIKTATLSSAGVLAAPYLAKSAWTRNSPNDRIAHAVIGTGRKGGGHCKSFATASGCELVAVSDVDPRQMALAVKGLANEGQIKKYPDFHRLLADTSIDSVTIATPDHWHTPAALWALMAGKHVYVEKPCSHNVRETNLLVKAAKQYGKCVQHGTQRRSDGDHIEAMRQLNQGIIGKVHTVKAINHQFREPIGKAAVEAPPAGVDYDRWLGPAPKVPFTKNRWHYEWHWFWDYGGGDITNDGVHQIDVAVWALGDRYPNRIVVSGGQYFYRDDHQTPDTQTAILEYDDNQIIYEMRLWTPDKLEGHDNGNVIYGTEGKMEFGRAGVVVTQGKEQRKIQSPEPVESIVPNFLTAVRENNPARLLSPIEKGAVAVNLCNLANIATRLGAPAIAYDAAKERVQCPGFEDKAKALLGRTYRQGYELPYQG